MSRPVSAPPGEILLIMVDDRAARVRNLSTSTSADVRDVDEHRGRARNNAAHLAPKKQNEVFAMPDPGPGPGDGDLEHFDCAWRRMSG